MLYSVYVPDFSKIVGVDQRSRGERLSYIHIPIDRPDRQTYQEYFYRALGFQNRKHSKKKQKLKTFTKPISFSLRKVKTRTALQYNNIVQVR